MASPTPSGYPPMLIGLAVALFVGVVSSVGLLDPLDGAAYDLVHRLFPPAATRPPAVVLLDWDAGRSDDAVRILAELRGLGAKTIAFAASPWSEPPESVLRGGDVVVGVSPGGVVSGLPTGAVVEPLTNGGVARQQRTREVIDGREYPTFDVTVASHAAPALPYPAGPYLVGYRGGAGSLPRVEARALLAGELVPELVQGRAVLVGRSADGTSPTLVTPTAPTRPGFTLLEYHGQAVNSLLTGTTVHTLPAWAGWLLLVGATTATALVVQWLDVRAAAWVLVAALAGVGLAVAGLFIYALVWVPFATLAVAQCGCVFLVQGWKADRAHRAVRKEASHLATATRDRNLPPAFADAAEPWPLLAGYVGQTLDVRRMVFLVAVGRRLEVVGRFGVEHGDIRETRRRLTDEPFASAVRDGRPVRLDAAFLTPADETEYQFLVPICRADRVLAVWVVAADAGTVDASPDFPDALAGFAQRMGDLLARRDRARRAVARRGLLARLLAGGAEDAESARIAQGTRALRDRMERAERVFAEGANAVASFDVFGRVLEVNDAMRARLQAAGLAVFQLNAADLVAALAGRDASFARRCVRHVLLDRRDVALPVTDDDGRSYLLRVFPLATKGGDADDLYGVGCELIDQTAVVRLRRLKDQLAGRVGVILRNDLAAVELAASLLSAGDLDPRERDEMAELVHAKVAQITRTLTEAQGFYAGDPEDDGSRLPVDPRPFFAAALADAEPAARARGVTVTTRGPAVLAYVVANPEGLRRLFGRAVLLLTGDARPGSELLVEVSETVGEVVYVLRNGGFGRPGDRLRADLTGDAEPDDADLRPLWQTAREAAAWGGRLDADGSPGDGIVLTLTLTRFN